MIRKLRESAEKIIIGGAILSMLGTAPVKAQDGWTNIQPGYDTQHDNVTVRLEAGSSIDKNLSMYGFLDTYSVVDGSDDQEGFYAELRLTRSVGGGVGIAVEYNGGSFMDDFVRLGLTYAPNLGEDNFTLLKLLPLGTRDDNNLQICGYSSHSIADIAQASILADYSPDTKFIYMEPEAGLKLRNDITAYVRGVISGSLDDRLEHNTTIVGIKYDF